MTNCIVTFNDTHFWFSLRKFAQNVKLVRAPTMTSAQHLNKQITISGLFLGLVHVLQVDFVNCKKFSKHPRKWCNVQVVA